MALVPAQGMSRAVIEDLDLGPYMINAAKTRAAQASKYKLPTGGAWERDTQLQNVLLTKSAQIIADPSLSDQQKEIQLAQVSTALQKSKEYGMDYDQTYAAVQKGQGTGDKGSPFDEETLEYHAVQRSKDIWSAAGLTPSDVSFDPVTGAVLLRGKQMDDFEFEYQLSDDTKLNVKPFANIQQPQQALDPFTTLIKATRIPYTVNETGDITIRDYNPERIAGQINEFVKTNARGPRVLREFTSSVLEEDGIVPGSDEFKSAINSPEYQAKAVARMNELIRNRADQSRTLDEARSGGAGSAAKRAGIRAYTTRSGDMEVLQKTFNVGDPQTKTKTAVAGQAVEFPALAVKPAGQKQQALVVNLGGLTDDGRLILSGRAVSANILEKSIGDQTAIEKLVGDTGMNEFIANEQQTNAFLAEFAKQFGYNQQLSLADFAAIINQFGGKFAKGVAIPRRGTTTQQATGDLNP